MGQQVWTLDELPPLKVGDRLGFRAEGWERLAVQLEGKMMKQPTTTWHWSLVGEKQPDDKLSHGDYSVYDSTSKGMTDHLLSEYQVRHMRVYRPNLPAGQQDAEAPFVAKRCKYYGIVLYDWLGVPLAAIWCILRFFGIYVRWRERNNRFWCCESVDQVNRDFDHQVVPDDEPAVPHNMENSPTHRLIWSSY